MFVFLIPGPPRIDRDHVHRDKIWCRAGKSLKLEDVEVEGEPPAKVTWSFKDVKQDKWSWKNIKISQGSKPVDPEYYTTILIENAERKQSGMYKIFAENEHGKDEEFVEVVFLGRPSPPLGPLEVYGVTQDSAKLNWRAPEDDGGRPIKKFIIEKMDMATKQWVPVGETPGDVTNIQAKGLEEGHEYLFRVKAVNDEGESEPLVADKAIKAKNAFGG